jgi:hypothetical protein
LLVTWCAGAGLLVTGWWWAADENRTEACWIKTYKLKAWLKARCWKPDWSELTVIVFTFFYVTRVKRKWTELPEGTRTFPHIFPHVHRPFVWLLRSVTTPSILIFKLFIPDATASMLLADFDTNSNQLR